MSADPRLRFSARFDSSTHRIEITGMAGAGDVRCGHHRDDGGVKTSTFSASDLTDVSAEID
jgi:hypothetical protein